MKSYIPKQGDFVVATFDPQTGHEQRGRRPALVISKQEFNQATGMAMICPVTHTNRHFPFHVPVPENDNLTGFIMVEQIKSLDIKARKVRHIGSADSQILAEVLAILDACVY
ncbi:MAG: type II toxin-antitoxin system PemK/MazF family toxin [Candidatus Marinimicrobia bacterium]|nr:type II toxin-antitoxin system PemK/MazF family toxin [Candidatus Neomarinimicrobiota bacterium]MCF7902584.1 type II toxin-antitoxin system PemK/MazF family toxin [Candidatus Neomarinimicrobiota bacterium]